MDGIILIHKPKNLTSHDIVRQIRQILNIKKVGHFGTLDPMATGLILVGVGKATRFFPFLSKLDKVYQGRMRLGFATDTYDAWGKPISSEICTYPDKETLLAAMRKYEGDILQQPPPYSAKKYQGKPLYYLARKKQEFKTVPVRIYIHHFRLTGFAPPSIDFEVKCSSGTYIRSIAHELGQDLGCGAHLSQLSRLEVGRYHQRDSFSIEEIKSYSSKKQPDDFLIPMESLLPELPRIILNETGSICAMHGNIIVPENIMRILPPEATQPVPVFDQEEVFRLFNPETRFIALAKKGASGNVLQPFLVTETK